MGGINKIYIISAAFNKPFKYFDKLYIRNGRAFVLKADFVILAKNAFKNATAEKHRAAADFTAYARLFPIMKRRPCKPEFRRRIAKSATFGAVYPTHSGALITNHISLSTSSL